MSVVRLNQSNRTAIFRGVVKHRFDNELKMLSDRYAEVAANVFTRTFSVEQAALLKSLPEGWCDKQSGIGLTVGGHSHYLRFDGAIFWDRHTRIREWDHGYYNDQSATRPMPSSYDKLSVSSRDIIAQELAQLERAKAKLQEEFGKVATQVNTMLKSYATVRTLVEAWPEVEPFIPPNQSALAVVVPSLPAVSIPSLNSMLRLPAPEEGSNVVRLVS